MIPLSILELARVNEGSDASETLANARSIAGHAEMLGYKRIWVAEHHNMPGIASAATSIVIAHLAGATSRIRVGAGGIMLPNHAPYIIAEQFGTLARLFPDRIDLGLGRAPGTDQLTLRALRRSPQDAENFPQDILELQAFLASPGDGQQIVAVPAAGTNVPLWILGSSHFGAMLAAELGLPYAFASHFAPEQMISALKIYRERFKPSEQLAEPYAMIGVNIIAAETDEEAQWLATTQKMSFVDIIRGARLLTRPPINDMENFWSPSEKVRVLQMLSCSAIGSVETVRTGLETLARTTGANELMVVSDVYDHATRLRSLELVAEAAGIETTVRNDLTPPRPTQSWREER
ncbi:LLM class flavin-dependent oxidoreductase [Neorhizobium alkalisoli]|uniref:LLM class flavin-dependent oxidoreductase n=1 Tax=Neorhizobium alkalisoli TaxID=528178 RepID=UPI000CF8E0AC|nr:LLM class flavin-dependent oxidoreductase [Neorhizobium alkalisoli]